MHNTPHPIKSYCLKYGIQLKWFAEVVGVSYGYLRQFLCGYRQPSNQVALAVERLTLGEISAGSIRKTGKYVRKESKHSVSNK